MEKATTQPNIYDMTISSAIAIAIQHENDPQWDLWVFIAEETNNGSDH